MYFKNFGTILYPFNINNKDVGIVMKDITKNIRIRKEVLDNVTLYEEYDIVDGETPEIISERVYGNPQYHWVIMLANNRFDYIEDFPKDNYTLQKCIESKYGDAADDIHHYENGEGFVVPADYPLARPISNRVHEEQLNESKRRIKIISPEVLPILMKNFKDLI